MVNNQSYQLHVIDKVLYVRLSGIWTKQLVKTVFSEVQKAVDDIRHQPWAAYVDMRDWIMPTMEAMADFQRIYQWCSVNNQTHEATVYKFAMQERIIKHNSSYEPEFQLYTKCPLEARQWLTQKGFPVSLQANPLK